MRYGKPIKNKKRIDPRYFLNEEAAAEEAQVYVIEKSGRGAEDMYLKKGSYTFKPLWGAKDESKEFKGENAALTAKVFIKQAGEAGANVDGWRVEKL